MLAVVLAAAVAPPSGDALLLRVKEVFRAHSRAPYVTYTLERRDRRGGVPDFENSYTLRVWCRTADRNALTRRSWRGRAYGDLENVTVAFDGRVDPGPPNADIFESSLFVRAASTASPAPRVSPLPTIGSVRVQTNADYRVTRVTAEGALLHLALAPKQDPSRARIDDLWVDAASYEVRRMRVRDHLYIAFGPTLEDEFDVRFAPLDGIPMIATIHGQTAGGEYETDYRFTDIAFPPALPAWYFEPRTYGMHRAEAPE